VREEKKDQILLKSDRDSCCLSLRLPNFLLLTSYSRKIIVPIKIIVMMYIMITMTKAMVKA